MAVPDPPPDPARPLLSFIPVFHGVVGTAVLLAAAGVTLAVVPALRRRRVLVTAWVLSVSAFSLAVLVGWIWILNES